MKKWMPLLALALSGCFYGHRRAPAPVEPPLSREEAERLSAAGISDAVILEEVERRGARRLSADDMVALKKAGAGDAVLEKMIASERRDPPVVHYEEHRHSHYYYHPYPLWGFSYGLWGRRSGWGLHFGW